MEKLLVVGVGGFLGAIARYGLSSFTHRNVDTQFPTGTLVVNLVGCLIIGSLMALVERHQIFSPNMRLFLTIGLLGSFTTFSTLGYETFELIRGREFLTALMNAGANMILGLIAVALGWMAIRFASA